MRRVLVFLSALVLLASACGREETGPFRYNVGVDAKSTAAEKFQFSAFFPADITAGAGDTLRFRNRATEAPHTITFGVSADRANQPPIILPAGENPVVTAPCDIDDDPTPELVKCDNDELGPYDGTGYWNSGFVQPAPAPNAAGPKTVTLQLADDIADGSYTFVCILHPFMSGKIDVTSELGDRTTPAEVREASQEAAAAAREEAEAFEEPELTIEGNTATAAAGWGNRVTAVNRFAPADIKVDAGTTVKWTSQNPYEPHTVTFAPPGDANPFAPPAGVRTGADYTGGFSHSGLYGAEGTPFAGEFSLRFPEAGTYEYTCLLHPGMDGKVTVT